MSSTALRPFYSRVRHGTLCTVQYTRLGGLRGRFGGGENSRPTPGFNPRVVHPVTTRCTEYPVAARGVNVGV